jgi:hypothetical protein
VQSDVPADAPVDPNAPPAEAAPPKENVFDPSNIPTKIPLIKPKTDSGLQVAVYHSEAAYAVRKYFIEAAKKHFVELEKAETSAILSHSYNHRYK